MPATWSGLERLEELNQRLGKLLADDLAHGIDSWIQRVSQTISEMSDCASPGKRKPVLTIQIFDDGAGRAEITSQTDGLPLYEFVIPEGSGFHISESMPLIGFHNPKNGEGRVLYGFRFEPLIQRTGVRA